MAVIESNGRKGGLFVIAAIVVRPRDWWHAELAGAAVRRDGELVGWLREHAGTGVGGQGTGRGTGNRVDRRLPNR